MLMHIRTLLLGLIITAQASAAAPSWPQFRGPQADGVSTARRVPLNWSETNQVVWKSALPGRGRSSPVVLGKRVWLTTALERGTVRKRIGSDDMQTTEHIVLKALCVDLVRGKVIWETELFQREKPDPVHWLNSWATPTPVIDSGRLYCDFGTYGTACLDASSGKVIWKKSVPLDHQVGPGSSPVLWKDLMILVRDGRDAQFVTALSRKTGEAVWRTDRPPIQAPVGDLKKSFVTPLLVETPARPQLVSPGAHWVVSYDPATGREHWRARHGEGFSIGTCPVSAPGMVVFGTGCFKPQLWAIGLGGDGDVTQSEFLWKSLKQVPIMSSPVRVGSELYYVSDDGMATCADLATGQPVWQERLGVQHLASPIHAEGRVYFFGSNGLSTVVKASRQFEKLAENMLDGPVVATPALVDGMILLRTDSHLYRIGR
jgi:outer membrane protein assembly factor BamB